MNRFRSERGQSLVLTTFFVAALLGMAALVIDLGTWFRSQRDLQAVADSAALAGAQGLPDGGKASAYANQYTNKNGANGPTVTFPNADQIKVALQRPAPGFFARVFGVNSVTIRASATAKSFIPGEARYAAPIAVDERHPLIAGCHPNPCFNTPTDLELEKVGPGAFRLINIDGSHGGTGPGILEDWLLKGYDGWMPIDWYFSDSGAKFNSSSIQSALTKRIGTEMLFPVYSNTRGGGANFEYKVIGWIGFVITSFEARGNNGILHGYFTRVVWEGIEGKSGGDPADDFGMRSIELIE
jgi:putative Flp pilus-assembly TadE/G-like protein